MFNKRRDQRFQKNSVYNRGKKRKENSHNNRDLRSQENYNNNRDQKLQEKYNNDLDQKRQQNNNNHLDPKLQQNYNNNRDHRRQQNSNYYRGSKNSNSIQDSKLEEILYKNPDPKLQENLYSIESNQKEENAFNIIPIEGEELSFNSFQNKIPISQNNNKNIDMSLYQESFIFSHVNQNHEINNRQEVTFIFKNSESIIASISSTKNNNLQNANPSSKYIKKKRKRIKKDINKKGEISKYDKVNFRQTDFIFNTKKRGRKKKDNIKKTRHTKYADDNQRKKNWGLFMNYILDLINSYFESKNTIQKTNFIQQYGSNCINKNEKFLKVKIYQYFSYNTYFKDDKNHKKIGDKNLEIIKNMCLEKKNKDFIAIMQSTIEEMFEIFKNNKKYLSKNGKIIDLPNFKTLDDAKKEIKEDLENDNTLSSEKKQELTDKIETLVDEIKIKEKDKRKEKIPRKINYEDIPNIDNYNDY